MFIQLWQHHFLKTELYKIKKPPQNLNCIMYAGLNLWCFLNLGFSYTPTSHCPNPWGYTLKLKAKAIPLGKHLVAGSLLMQFGSTQTSCGPLGCHRFPSIRSVSFSVFVSVLRNFKNFLAHNSIIYKISIWNSMRAKYFQFSLVTKHAETQTRILENKHEV